MCYFANCQKVPGGALVVLFSMELLFSVSILYYLHTYDREASKAVNTAVIDVHNDFMRDVNSWNRYKLSYNDYITNIIDALIVDQERAMLNTSQGDVFMLKHTFTEVCVCDGVDLVNPASNLGASDHTTSLQQSLDVYWSSIQTIYSS